MCTCGSLRPPMVTVSLLQGMARLFLPSEMILFIVLLLRDTMRMCGRLL